MFKAIVIVALISISGSAQADNISPWFGSEASPPEQIAINTMVDAKDISIKNPDCSIYNCATLVKIAKPEQKSASNP